MIKYILHKIYYSFNLKRIRKKKKTEESKIDTRAMCSKEYRIYECIIRSEECILDRGISSLLAERIREDRLCARRD